MVQLLPLRRRGETRFITLSLAAPDATTLVDEVLHLRAAVRTVRQLWPFAIDAWVVMPDHLHAIWTLPHGDRDFAVRRDAIRAEFARGLPDAALTPAQAMAGREFLWHPKAEEETIVDPDTRDAMRRHCWMDPVRHGYVTTPGAWPYSSYHRDGPQARGAGRCLTSRRSEIGVTADRRKPDPPRSVSAAQPFQIQPPPRMRLPSDS